MRNITDSIRHGFSNITNFTGRDRPRQFWPYVIMLYLVQTLISLIFTFPLMVEAMKTSFASIEEASRHGGPVDQAALQHQIMQQAMAATRDVMPVAAGLGIIIFLLAAAAIVRRLHDRDWSGWWVLLLIAGKALGLTVGYTMMNVIADDPMAMFEHMGTIQLLAGLPWIAYIILLIQLVQSGAPGENRFGPPPP